MRMSIARCWLDVLLAGHPVIVTCTPPTCANEAMLCMEKAEEAIQRLLQRQSLPH